MNAEKAAGETRAEPTAETLADPVTAERLAELFHETYERLAPIYHYGTRPESAVPWADVPTLNKALMIATSREILRALRVPAAPAALNVERLREAARRARLPHDVTVADIENIAAEYAALAPSADSAAGPAANDALPDADGLLDVVVERGLAGTDLPDEGGVFEWPAGGGRVSKYPDDLDRWMTDPEGAWVVLYAPRRYYDGLRLRAAAPESRPAPRSTGAAQEPALPVLLDALADVVRRGAGPLAPNYLAARSAVLNAAGFAPQGTGSSGTAEVERLRKRLGEITDWFREHPCREWDDFCTQVGFAILRDWLDGAQQPSHPAAPSIGEAQG